MTRTSRSPNHVVLLAYVCTFKAPPHISGYTVRGCTGTSVPSDVRRNMACYGMTQLYFLYSIFMLCAPGSSVGKAIGYGLDSPGSNAGGGRDFLPVQTGPGAHPASCKMGTGSFPGVKCGRGVVRTTHPFLVPRSWESRAIPLPTLWATPGL